jgi:hypothetical protein
LVIVLESATGLNRSVSLVFSLPIPIGAGGNIIAAGIMVGMSKTAGAAAA